MFVGQCFGKRTFHHPMQLPQAMHVKCAPVVLDDTPIFRLLLRHNREGSITPSLCTLHRFAVLHILGAFGTDDLHRNFSTRCAIDAPAVDTTTVLVIGVLTDDVIAEKPRRVRTSVGHQGLFLRECEFEVLAQKHSQLSLDLFGFVPWATATKEPV
jgi:hypothetical protein